MHRTSNKQHRKSQLVRWTARLSYANVAATLALFLALTGTATAAVTLARDSVGAEHIQADAVRVVRDPGGRRPQPGDPRREHHARRPHARRAHRARRSARPGRQKRNCLQPVSTCWTLMDCSNLLAIHLPAGRWLVQAKLTVFGDFGPSATSAASSRATPPSSTGRSTSVRPAGLPDQPSRSR